MNEIRVLSESDGVRVVTDGKDTWKEYPRFKPGVIGWIESELLFHPHTWYTKILANLLIWLIVAPLFIPVYQATFIYFASQWIGLDDWAWWQITIKLILLFTLWIPSIPLLRWVAQNSVGENGIGMDD